MSDLRLRGIHQKVFEGPFLIIFQPNSKVSEQSVTKERRNEAINSLIMLEKVV